MSLTSLNRPICYYSLYHHIQVGLGSSAVLMAIGSRHPIYMDMHKDKRVATDYT